MLSKIRERRYSDERIWKIERRYGEIENREREWEKPSSRLHTRARASNFVFLRLLYMRRVIGRKTEREKVRADCTCRALLFRARGFVIGLARAMMMNPLGGAAGARDN